MASSLEPFDAVVVRREDFARLIEVLCAMGYEVVGPTVSGGAVVYGALASAEDLPVGWTDEQEGGTYRLRRRDDAALFGYSVGPHSWKRFLHPPVERLWRADREERGFTITRQPDEGPRYALLGVRACELHAIAVQDRVFLHGAYVDPSYRARRAEAFIVAVNCGHAGGTCFCVSMQTGPKAAPGFDLALTELLDPDEHRFLVEVGSARAVAVLREVPHRMARLEDVEAGERIVERTARSMGRTLDTAAIKELLYQSYDHPRWDEVAGRCLTCANCTIVCPTCFCTTVEDTTDLTGEHAERWRKWDSCFTMDFSYIHGGSVRASARSRYRQWLTHKLATWHDQFGTSGCVGCGRCITWCPVAIDLTEEVRAIRATEVAAPAAAKDENDANA